MSLTPAQMVDRTGLTLDTLRYYEREGLIGPVDRTPGGQRCYEENDVFWAGLLTCLRDAGLGIADLREFTAMLRSDEPADDKVSFLRDRRDRLRARQDAIGVALQVMDEKIEHYSDAGSGIGSVNTDRPHVRPS